MHIYMYVYMYANVCMLMYVMFTYYSLLYADLLVRGDDEAAHQRGLRLGGAYYYHYY